MAEQKTKWSDGSRFIRNSELYVDPTDGKLKVDYREKTFIAHDDDEFHTITAAEEYRPDLIANKLYGRTDLDWILLWANDFESLKQFKAGTTIRVPTLNPWQGKVY